LTSVGKKLQLFTLYSKSVVFRGLLTEFKNETNSENQKTTTNRVSRYASRLHCFWMTHHQP